MSITTDFKKFITQQVTDPLGDRTLSKLRSGSRYKTGKMRRQTRKVERQSGFAIEVSTEYAERVDERYGYMANGDRIVDVVDSVLRELK